MANAALFLDRDGVINVDTGYVFKREAFKFIPGIFELASAAHAAGYCIVIITNQAGIGRGYYSIKDFWSLMDWVGSQFTLHGSKIDKVYFCPHHPDSAIGAYKISCDCRKPKPGMILSAGKDLELNLSESLLVGDKDSDIQAGIAAGIKKLFQIGNKAYGPAIHIASLTDIIPML